MSTQETAFTEITIERTESFGQLFYRDETWDLSHLDSFAFQYAIEPASIVVVVVLFSCHCFTHSIARDSRPRSHIPHNEIFDDGREQRVLCPDRYQASRQWLRDLVLTLAGRRIILADQNQPNFVTVETTSACGKPALYAVFFKVTKDKLRQGRLALRVQSAYMLDRQLSKRQLTAKKVTLKSILRAAMEGRTIRP